MRRYRRRRGTPQIGHSPSPPFGSRTRALLLVLAALWASPPALAQTDAAAVVTHRFVLRHQSAVAAVALIHPLLSERGAVELVPADNTVVIRDTREAVDRVLSLLRDFDRPAPLLRLEIQIVAAGPGADPEAGAGRIPDELLQRLRELLRYKSYRLLAATALDVGEGRTVRQRLSPEYAVEFRLDSPEADRRVKLNGFRVLRTRDGEEEPKSLIHTNLNLWMDRPMVLGLARTETSERALMVIVHCKRKGDRQR